ncbi:MAG: DUF6993 domain-containing protein [Lacisediminihabitans sp.]
MGRSRVLAAVVTAVVAVAALAGCAQSTPSPKPTPVTTTSPASTPTATPKPSLVPGGSAADDKPYFDIVNGALIASNGSVDGRTIIDNLVTAGFDKASMQLTPDKTSIGLNADSVLFSVRIDGNCLVGQRSATGYSSTIGPALKNGNCLVGKTRPITW